MKKILLLVGLLAVAFAASADDNSELLVRRNDGKMVPVPAWGSPEAQLITPRKHPDNFQEPTHTRAVNPSVHYTPHTGSPRILVILANFKDLKFRVENPKAAFNDFFNAPGAIVNRGNGNDKNHGSVAQYFKACSRGVFTPVFDVYGPVDLPQNMEYYGGNNANSNNDERPAELARDAVNLVKTSITNPALYDSNNDGYVDCVYVVYAGLGQNNGGGAKTVWACASRFTDPSLKLGDKILGRFSIGAELFPAYADATKTKMQINSIGVTCHEFSHTMGLPDIYPTTSSAYVHNQEMELWDLMDGGEYAGDGGFVPMPYTAWERQQMNWPLNIQPLTANANITMDKTANEGGVVYKMANPNDANEYFLLENIKKNGWYGGAPNGGLLVYKVVDYDPVDFFSHPNNTAGEPGMAVVPADGLCFSSYLKKRYNKSEPKYKELNAQEELKYQTQLKGDVFPGTGSVNKLNDMMGLPNFCWYTEGAIDERSSYNTNFFKVNQALENINVAADGRITLKYIADYKKHTTGIDAIQMDNVQTDNRIFSLDGRYMGTDKSRLSKGVYIVNHKKIVVQ